MSDMDVTFADRCAVVTGASRGIGEAVARQLDQEGARVALVARSVDRLRSIADELSNDPLVVPADLLESDAKRVPLARWGTAEEIAQVVCFLASDRASSVTGQTIEVDGGMTDL